VAERKFLDLFSEVFFRVDKKKKKGGRDLPTHFLHAEIAAGFSFTFGGAPEMCRIP
jgi:hypothetical protein